VGTELSALRGGRNGSRIRAIYVNFSGESVVSCVVSCVVKRGDEMVFCMVDFVFEKYANFSNFFFGNYSFDPLPIRQSDRGRLERPARRRRSGEASL